MTVPALAKGLRALAMPVLFAVSVVSVRDVAAFDAPAMLKDINPGAPASTPTLLQPFGNKLFFLASDATSGTEAWVSDGTSGGTFLLRDILAGSGSGLNPTCPTCGTVVIGGIVYFSAFDGSGGSELWRTDGTSIGTTKVYYGGTAFGLTGVGSKVFFTNSNSALCTSDGTPGGTGPIGAAAYLDGTNMIAIGGTAFFPATDGFSGLELWRSDGTPGGTSRVKDINPGSPDANPSYMTNVNGTLFFYASNGVGGAIYKSDGTLGGTVLVKQIGMQGVAVPTSRTQFLVVNGVIYFVGNESTHGSELWRSDGTPAGTYMVKDIYPGAGSGVTSTQLVAVSNTIFFAAADDTHSYELWKSDGTDAGTVMVKDINAGFSSSFPQSLANINGTLYFKAMSSFAAGNQVWTSDGTAAGTVPWASISLSDGAANANFTLAGGRLFFVADDGTHGKELWSAAATLGVNPIDRDPAGSLALSQNRPNPVHSSSGITYAIAVGQHVTLKLYDTQGREVRTLVDQMQPAGLHRADIDARGLSNGVYFYRLRTGAEVRERKLVIQK